MQHTVDSDPPTLTQVRFGLIQIPPPYHSGHLIGFNTEARNTLVRHTKQLVLNEIKDEKSVNLLTVEVYVTF